MKSKVTYFSICIMAGLLMYSCTKRNDSFTPNALIQGKWTMTREGTDDNEDGSIEAYEIKPVISSLQRVRVFKADGTGTETVYNQPVQSFKWVIVPYDTLKLYFKANDTMTYVIQNITSSDMTLVQYVQPTSVLEYYVRN